MRNLRLALAQINPFVGDIDGNVERIITYLQRARHAGADIVALPELAVTGYPPEDLLLKPSFVGANRQAPPGIRITPRAFGKDRLLPITNRFRPG